MNDPTYIYVKGKGWQPGPDFHRELVYTRDGVPVWVVDRKPNIGEPRVFCGPYDDGAERCKAVAHHVAQFPRSVYKNNKATEECLKRKHIVTLEFEDE
jgi:hypothetical protein